ncbi:F-box-containing protein [Naegleria gruberi]|uniref:F-box-containing protein n=1 Tax=Naegleria gruberi TaxID=5762 RepID=D2VQZ6_NAEGR|nr:F-box-containing protein [Naegleria gruberi]EFC40800.1 F-box-containing protein [Naegleria gruberi]|eukprot:XP_002673544.1 F-box-containing protein [Naegleria gruberi strain NEG-M]
MGQQHTTLSSNRIILDDLNLEKIIPIEIDYEELELMDQESEYLDRNDPNVFNENNQSLMERMLPYELVINVMRYLPNSDIIKLMRVSKNFAKYWIFQPLLWKDQLENRGKQPNCLLKPMRLNVHSALVHFHDNLVPRIRGAIKSGQLVVGEQKQPKIGIAGYGSCGKSTWIKRFSNQINYLTTRFDYSEHYNLELIKIPGINRFVPYNVGQMQQCNILFYCFDVSSIESFNICKQMISYFEKVKAEKNLYEYLLDKNRFLGLVGMKSDKEKKVTNSMITQYLEEIIPEFYLYGGIDLIDCRVQYFELSSKFDSIEKLEFPFLYSLFVLRKVLPTQETRSRYW